MHLLEDKDEYYTKFGTENSTGRFGHYLYNSSRPDFAVSPIFKDRHDLLNFLCGSFEPNNWDATKAVCYAPTRWRRIPIREKLLKNKGKIIYDLKATDLSVRFYPPPLEKPKLRILSIFKKKVAPIEIVPEITEKDEFITVISGKLEKV